MKNYLIIFSLFLVTCAYAYQVTYYENLPRYGYCPCNSFPYNRTYGNNFINPYNPHYRNYNPFLPNNPWQIQRNIQRNIQRARQNKRLKRISFLNKNKNGNITGYSVPINQDDIYRQMGISPYDPKAKQRYNSINCSQELFSAPSGDETYYKNGEYYKDLKGTSGKTGVTIIYD